jgi:poly(A) polymerase
MELIFSKLEYEILQAVASAAENLGIDAYAVGGFVRDKIMHRQCKDIDFVCIGSGIDLANETAHILNSKLKVNFFKNFGTAHFSYKNIDIEFVGARKESYSRDSRKPIVEQGTLEDDQIRRDFTINALAIHLDNENFGRIIDPFGGLEDIENKLIRTPQLASQTFDDDPLRMLRAIRFASTLNFKIEENTYQAIEPLVDRLKIISMERIINEVNKIILSKKPSIGFKHLYNTKLLHQFFPEMVALQGVTIVENYGHKDNFFHTLKVLDNVADMSDNLWLRWAAIMHDIAKPRTQRFENGHGWTFHGHEAMGAKMTPKIFERLKLPSDERMKYVQKLVELHLRPIALTKETITDAAIRRLIFDAGNELEDLLLLCQADITSKNEEKVQRYLANLMLVKQRIVEVEERDKIRNWQPPIDGELIMNTFNIPPSKIVGDIKNIIRESILDGKIPNDVDAAKSLMHELGHKFGLNNVKI